MARVDAGLTTDWYLTLFSFVTASQTYGDRIKETGGTFPSSCGSAGPCKRHSAFCLSMSFCLVASHPETDFNCFLIGRNVVIQDLTVLAGNYTPIYLKSRTPF